MDVLTVVVIAIVVVLSAVNDVAPGPQPGKGSFEPLPVDAGFRVCTRVSLEE
jgi:hypothetical protein